MNICFPSLYNYLATFLAVMEQWIHSSSRVLTIQQDIHHLNIHPLTLFLYIETSVEFERNLKILEVAVDIYLRDL